MIHVISHGALGESVLITEPTEDEAAFAILEYCAEHPGAVFGPNVPRVTGDWGAAGIAMAG